MAQTGYTPILIYSSSTGGNTPAAGNLTNSTLGSELAINITDGKLFYKDNANAIQVIGWKTTPTTAGGTGLTSYTAGDLLYYATGTTLSKLAIGTAYYMLGVNAGGTAPSWQPSATSVLTTQGDLLYASAANTLARLAKNTSATRYLSNGGTNNNPAWAQIDLTNGVTGALPTGNGGTGQTSFTAGDLLYYASGTALSKLGIGAANTVLTSSGTAPQWSTSLSLAGNLSAANISVTDSNWIGWGNYASRFTGTGGGSVNVVTNSVTAGTWDTSQNYTAYGNIVQGTAAKGFNFTANSAAAGMTSQLLNWYEEGTWTPNQGSGLTVVGAFSSSGKYTRIGRQVTIQGSVSGATSVAIAATATQICSNLPYSSSPAYSGSMFNAAVAGFGGIASSGSIVYATSTMGATTSITFSITYTI